MARVKGISIVGLVLAMLHQPAFGDDLSALFEGKWTGNGTIRPQSFDTPEKARCRVAGTRAVNGATRFSGRCATVSGSGTFKLNIRLVPGTERYEVEAQLADLVQTVRMRGRAQGTTLILSLMKPLKQHGRTMTGEIEIEFPDDGSMVMTQTAMDISTGEQAEAVSMIFKRRQ